MRTRLDPEERRRCIVDAAVPLFARKGFNGTTTKEIAEAAGVSEGLVFKYFASKTALYDAILDHCQTANPAFERLQAMAPSSETLVAIVAFFVEYFASVKDRPEAEVARHRLFIRSLLEDGEFADAGLQMFADAVTPVLGRSLAVAKACRDVTCDLTDDTAFRLAAMMQIMIGTFALPDRAMSGRSADRGGKSATIVADATRFILRGIGMSESAIARLYRPNAMTAPTDHDNSLAMKLAG